MSQPVFDRSLLQLVHKVRHDSLALVTSVGCDISYETYTSHDFSVSIHNVSGPKVCMGDYFVVSNQTETVARSSCIQDYGVFLGDRK